MVREGCQVPWSSEGLHGLLAGTYMRRQRCVLLIKVQMNSFDFWLFSLLVFATCALAQTAAPAPPATTNAPAACLVDDALANTIEAQWRATFPSTHLFPFVGIPSTANGVATLYHTTGTDVMTINGLPARSSLANYALYSLECSQVRDFFFCSVPF